MDISDSAIKLYQEPHDLSTNPSRHRETDALFSNDCIAILQFHGLWSGCLRYCCTHSCVQELGDRAGEASTLSLQALQQGT
eukprot:2680931-Amphidinium_carterae.1